jgi:tRNA U38,U39,U40 pseudouridine synthase TruA
VPVSADFDARYSARWKRYAYYVVAGGGGGAALPFAWGRYSWRVSKKCLDHDAMVEAACMMSDGERNFEWLCVLQRGEMRNTRRKVNLRVERVNVIGMTTIATTDGTAGGDGDDDGTPYFLRGGGDGEDDAPAIYRIHCTCDFFLYKMMRRIVGVLVAVGGGDASLGALRSCLDEYDDYYHRGDDSEDDRIMQNDGGGATAGAKKAEKNKPAVPPKLLNTAPAKGLCLEHIEYDIAI